MSVLVVEHVPWEPAGRIHMQCLAEGLDVRTVNALRGDRFGEVESLAGVVVMGGPMRATDWRNHPRLEDEVALLRDAVTADVPCLGICLGHQLLALACGGSLETAQTAEIGVAPVEVMAESVLGRVGDRVDVLHWHADVVSLPSGADLLARSDQCENQAFRLGSAVGLQFHLEVDQALFARWLSVPEMAAELPAGIDHEAALRAAEPTMAELARMVFSDFTSRASARAGQLSQSGPASTD
ncbi:type 1 glutamine amidotransferase [Nocardioides bizhenqiangii]|uniref:Type 1 glutamine amidotransferase n=1 Tax=Nocardioides bizhenqiangii TaxID=3095076 RepID=A0ABZ0ZWB0_9ACTN|nr:MULTISPECIES: type 1 glutamine amidotransferase [unclassified Nocardioides]MDZ5621751.1 type 1 glutamine amidotransferase [Nocardioides sp. HM23]WQQ27563.1 type 1 glutamine amidotransferase [Nocardioides sp. HM61]